MENVQMQKLGFEKAEELEVKLPTFVGSYKKQENSRKTSISLTTLKTLTVWITTSCEKFLKRWEYQTTYLTSLLRNLYASQEATVITLHGTADWFTVGKGVCQGCILSRPDYSTHMQSTSCKMPGWINPKVESRLPGQISIISGMQMTPPLWQKAKKN